jgi:hypothetical protein
MTISVIVPADALSVLGTNENSFIVTLKPEDEGGGGGGGGGGVVVVVVGAVVVVPVVVVPVVVVAVVVEVVVVVPGPDETFSVPVIPAAMWPGSAQMMR